MLLTLLFSLSALANTITIEDGYVRMLPPSAPNTAAFMKLINPSDKEETLIKASSSYAKVVELHTHMMSEGMMKMREVEKIELKPNSTTHLKKGGLHIMLIDLQKKLKVGDKVDLELQFSSHKQKLMLPIK